MLYEVARKSVIHDFRNESAGELCRDCETGLLNKRHSAFSPAAVGRTRDAASAAPANTKTQQ